MPWPISSGGEISNQIFDGTDHRKYIRLQLGSRTLFALEHMIASDLHGVWSKNWGP
ncbi:MAG: putative membrane protein, partial [Candidatus Azotimanducaceae bacterium]